MASLKTSQELSGSPIEINDLHRIARNGNNFKLTSQEIFSEEISYNNFEAKRIANKLIVGRWYKVYECGYDQNQTILVLADTINTWNRRIKWLRTPNDSVECDATELNTGWTKYYDSEGNTYYNYHNAICEFPPIGKGVNWKNVIVDKGTQCCFTNVGATNGIESTYFNSVNLNLKNYQIFNSNFLYVTNNNKVNANNVIITESNLNSFNYDDQKKDGQITFNNCNFKNVEIFFSGPGDVTLINLDLKDVSIIIDGSCNIQESSFNNCSLEIYNQSTVQNLNIFGKGKSITNYKINGALQNRVLNNWAGTVVADEYTTGYAYTKYQTGFSTVKMVLGITDDYSTNEGIFDTASNVVYLPEKSIIGIYLFGYFPINGNYVVDQISDSSTHTQHKIEFGLIESQSNVKVNFLSQSIASNIGSSGQILEYHGKTAKVGELKNSMSNLILKGQYNDLAGLNCWLMIYGNHYD